VRCEFDRSLLIVHSAERCSPVAYVKTDQSLVYPPSNISRENSIDCDLDVAIIEQIVIDFLDYMAPAACAPISRLTE
jgi:hypothetical protein